MSYFLFKLLSLIKFNYITIASTIINLVSTLELLSCLKYYLNIVKQFMFSLSFLEFDGVFNFKYMRGKTQSLFY